MLGVDIGMGAILEQTMVIVSGRVEHGGVGIIIEFPPPHKIGAPGGTGLQRTGGKANRGGGPGV